LIGWGLFDNVGAYSLERNFDENPIPQFFCSDPYFYLPCLGHGSTRRGGI
jgi:hypothetical protein